MSDTKSSGISFWGLLTIVFITLKLTHYIDWSWWWVLCIVWVPMALIFALLIIYFICSLILQILQGS